MLRPAARAMLPVYFGTVPFGVRFYTISQTESSGNLLSPPIMNPIACLGVVSN